MEKRERQVISETAEYSQGFLSAKYFVLELVEKPGGPGRCCLGSGCCYYGACPGSCGPQHRIPAQLGFTTCSGCSCWSELPLAWPSVCPPLEGSITPRVALQMLWMGSQPGSFPAGEREQHLQRWLISHSRYLSSDGMGWPVIGTRFSLGCEGLEHLCAQGRLRDLGLLSLEGAPDERGLSPGVPGCPWESLGVSTGLSPAIHPDPCWDSVTGEFLFLYYVDIDV